MNNFTTVELLWLERRHRKQGPVQPRSSRTIASTVVGVFSHSRLAHLSAFVRWASSDFGAAIWRVDILRAATPGQRYSTVPWVKPGGDILLRITGWSKVERVLQLVDAVEALDIHPADVAPIIGTTSTTACPSTRRRARTRAHATRRGCASAGLHHEKSVGDHSYGVRCGSRAVDHRTSDANLHMERLEQCPGRSLPVAAREGQLAVTELVAVRPGPLAAFLGRTAIPVGVPMLKRVLAPPGQTVCRQGLRIFVDAIEVGDAERRDGRGRPLPAWQGCCVVGADELFFLMNWQSEDSLDGRYFGFVPNSSVIGKALPVWTWEE